MKIRLLTVILAMTLACIPVCLMAAQQLPVDDKAANPHQAAGDTPIIPKPRPEDGWKKPIIRHDWTDVLNSSEDPSQRDTGGAKSYDDLTGAVFSYSRDSKNSSDNWTAMGAVIIPRVSYWDAHYLEDNNWKPIPIRFVVAPSLSLNKVSSSGNVSNEVDHLDARLGFYSKWLPQQNVFTGLLFRGALMYGTDTGFHASLPAVELEIEPQFFWQKSEIIGDKPWGIGYKNGIFPYKDKDNQGNIIIKHLLTYQLRGWLRMEGGDLQRNNAKWETVDGSFFRAGPEFQGAVNFSKGIIKGAYLNVNYSYLPTIYGPSGNSSLLKICAALTLYENDKENQNDYKKVSLTASFQKGGLILSKQEVEIFNIGIGVVF